MVFVIYCLFASDRRLIAAFSVLLSLLAIYMDVFIIRSVPRKDDAASKEKLFVVPPSEDCVTYSPPFVNLYRVAEYRFLSVSMIWRAGGNYDGHDATVWLALSSLGQEQAPEELVVNDLRVSEDTHLQIVFPAGILSTAEKMEIFCRCDVRRTRFEVATCGSSRGLEATAAAYRSVSGARRTVRWIVRR
ncbi:ORF209 [Saltwater crocodilepox virus]|nr:ORF209 [Saltwater crocodilepox virus]